MEDENPRAAVAVAVAEDCDIDPYEQMKIELNSDGTLTRFVDSSPDSPITSKDIPFNTTKNTWIRVYQPRQPQPQPPGSILKLPVIIFYHGGGFIAGSLSQDTVHRFCSNMCAQLRVIVVSAGYRLAPEHRLPVAYEDTMEAIFWLKNKAQEALTNHDLSRCFLMGDSAGSNIAYHVGLRAALVKDEILPLKIAGLILHEPFFGGVKRTESEHKMKNDPGLPLSSTDLMWNLSLPVGSNRDHFFCNPLINENEYGDEYGERIIRLLKKCSVTGWEGDPLIDRMKMFVNMLEGMGVEVAPRFGEGGFHGLEVFDKHPDKLQAIFSHISDFISKS